MTDTGGDIGYEGGRGKARRKLRKMIDSAGSSTKPKKPDTTRPIPPVAPRPPVPILPIIIPDIPDEVFDAPELAYYLKRMARFIQKAVSGGPEAAATSESNITPESPFSAVQRRIRLGAPGNAASSEGGSQHHDHATRAFQAGSTAWAIGLIKHGDPTVFKVKQVAMAVNKNGEKELVAAAKAILRDYGEQTLDSFTSGDDKLMSVNSLLRKEYHARLDQLFSETKPADWREENVDETLRKFAGALLTHA